MSSGTNIIAIIRALRARRAAREQTTVERLEKRRMLSVSSAQIAGTSSLQESGSSVLTLSATTNNPTSSGTNWSLTYTGNVSGPASVFVPIGQNYSLTLAAGDEGNGLVDAHVSDAASYVGSYGSATLEATFAATVADAPLTGGVPFSFSGYEGASFSNVIVGSFTDQNASASTADFTGTITWGDGTATSPGTIVSQGSGHFLVQGSHQFTEETAPGGSYYGSVAINDDGGRSVSDPLFSVVADASLTGSGTVVPATEGASTYGFLGSFTDANASAPASDFTGTITWGDGTATSPGTISSLGGGRFAVNGAHQFAEEGSYFGSFAVNDDGGQHVNTAFISSISDAPISATAVNISATSGVTFTGTVAKLTDGDAGGAATDYSATIDWGDGSGQSAGTIVSDGAGGWLVQGSHTYLDAGNYTMTVLAADVGGGTATTQPAAKVLNPVILVDGQASENVSLYESQTKQVVVSVLDPTNNNAPLNGWIVIRSDNHGSLVADNTASNAVPPTGQNGQQPGQTTVTLSVGQPTAQQNPVAVMFTAKSPNFRQPNNANVGTVNVTVKSVLWNLSNSRQKPLDEKDSTLSTKKGAGGDSITATLVALDATTLKPITGVTLYVNDTSSDGTVATVNNGQLTTNPNTGSVTFTMTSRPKSVGFGGAYVHWSFTDLVGTKLVENEGIPTDCDITVHVTD